MFLKSQNCCDIVKNCMISQVMAFLWLSQYISTWVIFGFLTSTYVFQSLYTLPHNNFLFSLHLSPHCSSEIHFILLHEVLIILIKIHSGKDSYIVILIDKKLTCWILFIKKIWHHFGMIFAKIPLKCFHHRLNPIQTNFKIL